MINEPQIPETDLPNFSNKSLSEEFRLHPIKTTFRALAGLSFVLSGYFFVTKYSSQSTRKEKLLDIKEIPVGSYDLKVARGPTEYQHITQMIARGNYLDLFEKDANGKKERNYPIGI